MARDRPGAPRKRQPRHHGDSSSGGGRSGYPRHQDTPFIHRSRHPGSRGKGADRRQQHLTSDKKGVCDAHPKNCKQRNCDAYGALHGSCTGTTPATARTREAAAVSRGNSRQATPPSGSRKHVAGGTSPKGSRLEHVADDNLNPAVHILLAAIQRIELAEANRDDRRLWHPLRNQVLGNRIGALHREVAIARVLVLRLLDRVRVGVALDEEAATSELRLQHLRNTTQDLVRRVLQQGATR